MRTIFLLLSFTISIHCFAQTTIEDYAQSKQWKRLLHYQKNSLSGEASLVDGPGFFFAKNGKTDALAELKATIEAFNNDKLKVGAFNLHPQCAFPARKWFVENKIGIKLQSHPKCEKLDNFIDKFQDPHSVSVIFSSAYPNNPASMFGHSFLKFNSKKLSSLTSIGVNYAARVPQDENPFAFMYFGVTGGYSGQWSTSPYHQKIKEYNQSENRDLWEYELNLNPFETQLLLYHLWEIETNSYFAYYFFDENCSYQILAAIEAVRPDWTITDHTIYVIPGESVKNLFSSPDIVKSVKLRPSVQRKVKQKYKALNKKEREEFFTLIHELKPVPEAAPLALDAAIEYFQFLDIKKTGQLSEAERKQQLDTLQQRAAMGPQPQLNNRLKPIASETRPDLGHDSYSAFLSHTLRQRKDAYGFGGSTNLKVKSSYHDLMNNDLGYKRYSHIDFPSITLQYDYDIEQFRIAEMNALSITSLNPIGLLQKSPSWKFSSGLYSPNDYGCLSCRHVFAEAGVGATLSIINDKNLFYFMVTGRGEVYDRLWRGYRYGPGLEGGLILNPLAFFKLYLKGTRFWDLDQRVRAKALNGLAVDFSLFLARNWEFRVQNRWTLPEDRPTLQQFSSTVGFIHFMN